MNRTGKFAAALLAAWVSITASASAAEASPNRGAITPLCVAPDAGYSYVGRSITHIDHYRATGTQGMLLTVSVNSGVTLTGSVGGQVSGDLSAIIAGAKAQVDASIALSKTVGASASASWTVPTASGWLAVGATAQSGNWQYGYFDCTGRWVVQRSGSYRLPTIAPSFYHS